MDFIQAYPQSPIDYDLYMDLPKGFKNKDGDSRTHVLQLLKNLYGQNQEVWVCNHHLNDVHFQFGLKKSAVDECVWYKDKIIFFYYAENGIFMGPEYKSIDRSIEEIEIA